jgi:hypothetical protein
MRIVCILVCAATLAAPLPAQEPPWAAPDLITESFTSAESAAASAALPQILRLWLASYVERSWNETLQYGHAGLSKAEQAQQRKEILAALKVFPLPVRKAGDRLYLVNNRARDACGATGNCTLVLVEEAAGAIHSIASESGWGFYTRFRAGSPYPDVFIATHMSSRETAVTGYANIAGAWRRRYCAGIFRNNDGGQTTDVHVCP